MRNDLLRYAIARGWYLWDTSSFLKPVGFYSASDVMIKRSSFRRCMSGLCRFSGSPSWTQGERRRVERGSIVSSWPKDKLDRDSHLISRKKRRVLELSVTQIRGVTKWYSAVCFDRRRVSLTSRAVRSEAAKQLPGLEIASIVPDTHSLGTISMRPVGCELGVALRLSSLFVRLGRTWRKCEMPRGGPYVSAQLTITKSIILPHLSGFFMLYERREEFWRY